MNDEARRHTRRSLRAGSFAGFLTLLMCLLILGACNDSLSHFSSYHQNLNFKGMNYAAADRLIQSAGERLNYQKPIYGKALQRSDGRNSDTQPTPAFAGVVVEHAAQRIKRHGYNIQPAAEPGEDIESGIVLTGFYTRKPDNVNVELILKTASEGREISSFAYNLERTYKIDKLLRTRPVRNEARELMNQMINSF